jgi:hypothetical protein
MDLLPGFIPKVKFRGPSGGIFDSVIDNDRFRLRATFSNTCLHQFPERALYLSYTTTTQHYLTMSQRSYPRFPSYPFY